MSLLSAINPIESYRVPIFSLNITAPIYNIPLQRALIPTSECPGWWINLTPFIQPNAFKVSTSSFDDFRIKNIEGGLLVGLGYYGQYWYIREVAAFVGSETRPHCVSDNFNFDNESKFVLFDDLVALGLKTRNERNWQLSGEGFYGISNAKIKHFKEVDDEHVPLVNALSMGTGAQVNFSYARDESADTMGEVLALSRFTYFIPVKVADIPARSNFNKQDLGSIHYSPGAFFDLFFSYKHYWGTDLRHQYEIGYNPTIHVMKESVKAVTAITPFTEVIPTVLNTFYVAYRYTRDGRMPISLSIGATLSIAEHIRSSGTFFAMFAIRI